MNTRHHISTRPPNPQFQRSRVMLGPSFPGFLLRDPRTGSLRCYLDSFHSLHKNLTACM